MSKKSIQAHALRMIKDNEQLRVAQYAYERMSRLQYSLPSPLQEWQWIRPIISTAPYDALSGGKRALVQGDMKPTIRPITVVGKNEELEGGSMAVKERANRWEKTLAWAVENAMSRIPTNDGDIMWSGLVYDEVVGQLIHIPTQKKLGALDSVRAEAALIYGDWAIRIADVKEVYIDYSEYMAERVLSVKIKTGQELVDFWGDAAKKIATKIAEDPELAKDEWIEFDYVDYRERMVWAVPGRNEKDVESNDAVVIFGPEPWLTVKGKPVPFLPWVCVIGGTSIDSAPQFRRKPLLYPVYMAEQWATSNILQTLEMSQALAEAGTPRDIFSGGGTEDIEVERGEPGGRIDLKNQMQTYQRIQQMGLDPSLRESIGAIETAMKRATIADVLISAQPVSGEQAYASYQLQVQQAVASLGPYRMLAERFYKQLLRTMLLWVHYTGGEITAYGDETEEYYIDSQEINPERIQIDVEITPDVPADRVQRITAAVNMSERLEYPRRRILEFLGETDPEGAIAEYRQEALERADFEGWLEAVKSDTSGQLEQFLTEMAQGMQQQMMEEQAAMTPEQAGGMANAPNIGAPAGIEGVGGQGFNPAMGGQPPVTASPAGTQRPQR